MNFDTKKELITLASNGDQRKMKWKTAKYGYNWRMVDPHGREYPHAKDDEVENSDVLEFQPTENNLTQRMDELQTELDNVRRLKERVERFESHQKEPIFTIEDKTIDKIKEIVNKVERYKGIQQFVNESLDNITTMWLEPEKMEAISAKMWKDLTPEMIDEFKKNPQLVDYVYGMELKHGDHTKVKTMKDKIEVVKDRLSKYKFPKPKNTERMGI